MRSAMRERMRTSAVEYSLATLARANSRSNTFLAIAGLAATLPAEAALISVPVALMGAGMKYKTMQAYRKTIVVLKEGSEKRGALAAQRLAAKCTGTCTYKGMKESFRDHFGPAWKEEFRKLEFPYYADAFRDLGYEEHGQLPSESGQVPTKG